MVMGQDGFKEVGDMIKVYKDFERFKLVILLIGRADLWETDRDFKLHVSCCLQAIRDRSLTTVILFCAVIPAPRDSPQLRCTAGFRHGYLANLAAEAQLLDFSKPGKFLLHNGQVVLDYFDPYGNLNERGLDQVRHALFAKIKCAALFKKYHDACNTNKS